MEKDIFVSLVIPCRNEKKYIAECLSSIVDQDFNTNNMEVLIVDGMSDDGTRTIIDEYSSRYPSVKVLDNPRHVTPAAMNIGINNARGDVIMKMDAHTIYDKHYVSNSVRYLKEYKVDNIGGYLIPIVQRESLSGQLIVAVLSSRFGVGNSYFRIGSEKPRGVDTVAFGCYRREVFERIGLYNEGLRRGQDMEFNIRLKKAGGKILLHPSIVAYYYPPDTLWAFVKHSFTNGVWAIIPFKHSKTLPVSIRHIVPLGFVVSLFLFSILGFANPGWWACLFVVISLYLIISIVYTVNYVGKKKDLWLVLMPIVFMLFHISYGIGSIYGVCKCFFSASFWENIVYCLRKPKMTKSLRI